MLDLFVIINYKSLFCKVIHHFILKAPIRDFHLLRLSVKIHPLGISAHSVVHFVGTFAGHLFSNQAGGTSSKS